MSRNERVLEALNVTARHATEVSVEFFRGMAARMCVSFEKYGAVRDAYPSKVHAINSLKLRLDKYLETGNTEYLMDVANFAMIEYMAPGHAGAHFKAEDSAASPGRTHHTGVTSQESNTSANENVRLGGTRGATSGGFYKREGD